MKRKIIKVKADYADKRIAGMFGKVRGEEGFNLLVNINNRLYSIPRNIVDFLD